MCAGANHILAVDVGAQDDAELHNYGDWLSGWQILWQKLNPFCTLPRIPSQVHYLRMRSSLVADEI